ncbi:hypothetical protein MUG91_G22n249 [Manis pentadactyla]|nr:hypothetical protein MUG91_G22n249 [Manis pentadactyla]
MNELEKEGSPQPCGTAGVYQDLSLDDRESAAGPSRAPETEGHTTRNNINLNGNYTTFTKLDTATFLDTKMFQAAYPKGEHIYVLDSNENMPKYKAIIPQVEPVVANSQWLTVDSFLITGFPG